MTPALGRVAGSALSAWLLAGAAGAQDAGSCEPGRIDLRGDWGQAQFRVAVADTAEERARGLMFVERMPRGEGMLFAYPEPEAVSFWMRNTLIPLDMIFMSERGVVTAVHENAVPGDETPIPGGEGVQYVLEVNGGLAGALGIAPGSEARHPAIGADAAWPCEAPDS